MNALDAYEALFLGRFANSYDEFLGFRRRVLRGEHLDLLREGVISKEGCELIERARHYSRSVKPQALRGIGIFDSIYDLLLFHEDLALRWQPDLTAYRGQLCSWPLVPTLYREPSMVANKLLWTKLAAKSFSARTSMAADLDELKVLAILQHYGYPTFLLDFTKNIRVAAAFACREYEPALEGTFGVIYKVGEVDYRDLVPEAGSMLGRRSFVGVNDIPRISLQEAVFLQGFKTEALEQFTCLTRYLFRHGPASREFCMRTGLTDAHLFPEADQIPKTLIPDLEDINKCEQQIASDIKRGKLLSSVCQMLDSRVIEAQVDVLPTDYLELAARWARWESLSAERRRESEVLCRWFYKVSHLTIPALCRDLRVLQMGVDNLIIDPYVCAETSTDIFERLRFSGESQRTEAVRQLFVEARAEACVSSPTFGASGQPRVRADC